MSKSARPIASERNRRTDRLTMASAYDLIVIGSGPGGYVDRDPRRAARPEDGRRRAARISAASASTGAASRPRRCLRSAEIFHYIEHAKDYGLSAKDVELRRRRSGEALARRSRRSSPTASASCSRRTRSTSSGATATITAPGKVAVAASGQPAERRARRPAIIRPSTSSSPPARGRGRFPASSPTAS